MALILLLLAFAVLTLWSAPLILTLGSWRIRYPRLALALWHGALGSSLAAIAASVAVTATTALAHGRGVGEPLPWYESIPISIGAWFSLGAVGAVVAVVYSHTEPILSGDRATRRELRRVIALCGQREEERDGLRVSIVESDLPFAAALPGGRGEIVVSTRLERELTPGQLRAVLSHERAHLSGRHAFARQLAAVNEACLPRMLGPREFQRATRLLIELIADDSAARTAGGDQLAGALTRLSEIQDDPTLPLRAARVAGRPPRSRAVRRAHARAHTVTVRR